MRLIATQLERPTYGFDYLRLLFALWVIAYHSVALTHRAPPTGLSDGAYRVLGSVPVSSFFALSGFLVGGAADRSAPLVYLANRALRLWPALAVVSALTVFVVGPVITSLTLKAYFADFRTWTQFGILVGVAQTELPGFQGFALRNFNGSLWSIPWEMGCYYGLLVVSLAGGLRKRWMLLASVLALFALRLAEGSMTGDWQHSLVKFPLCFAIGAALYGYRDRIPASLGAALASTAIALTLIWLGWTLLAPFPLSYGVVALGLQPARKLTVDLSYGVYIVAFPIQQMLSLSQWGRVWWINLALAAAGALLYAAASWHFIEAPALRLKPVVRRWLEARSQAKDRVGASKSPPPAEGVV